MGDKIKGSPRIRFIDFTDAWEQRRLGEIYNFLKGKNLSLDSFVENDYEPAIAYGHLYTKYSEFIDRVNVSSNQEGIMSKKGDILFPSSSTVPNGTCQANAILLDEIKLGGDIIIARNNNSYEINPLFMSYLINAQKKKMFPITTGTTITHMYGKDLEKLEYSFPQIAEQTKIGTFFKNLDNLITLHQRKLELLKESKKGMRQKMLPKDGESVPEIRFAGFTDAWEQRKLREVAIYTNGTAHESDLAEDGKYELINLNSILIDGGLKSSNKFVNTRNGILKKNDLVMVLSDVAHGDLLGRVAIIPENNRFVLNQRVASLTLNETCEIEFMFSCINSKQLYFKKQGVGSSQLNITKGSVEEFEFYLPQKIEQTQIGIFFKTLDNLITCYQRELYLLKDLKKSMLQQMFVQEKEIR